LFKAHDPVCSPGGAIIETFGLELFVNPASMKDYMHAEFLKTGLSANLPYFYPQLCDLYETLAKKKWLSNDSNRYMDLIAEFCYPIVCLMTTRSILGPEFDHEEELHQMFIDYNRVISFFFFFFFFDQYFKY
jgi:hypothetical protein